MSRYDDLFDEVPANDSVFADKSALDPLAEPAEIVPRTEQEQALASVLTGVTEGYLPTPVSIYGPPVPERRSLPDGSGGSSPIAIPSSAWSTST